MIVCRAYELNAHNLFLYFVYKDMARIAFDLNRREPENGLFILVEAKNKFQ